MNEKVQNFVKNYIDNVTKHLNITPKVEVSFIDDVYLCDITGDDLNFLIGYRGTSLDGLQHMLNLALFNEFDQWQNITVDINDYRRVKKEKLEDMAKSFIDRARFFLEEVEMTPMSAFERKQIHEFVSAYDDVESFSVGEGYSRRVVLRPSN